MNHVEISNLGVDTIIKSMSTASFARTRIRGTDGIHHDHARMTAENLPDGTYTPEASLWRAVLAQAVSDATWVDPTPGEPIPANKRDMSRDYCRWSLLQERAKAQAWLLGGGIDFLYVCEMAGFEPGYVRRCARRLLGGCS